ncbi:MAG: rhomboid family intramembrane serine protease [Bacteroidales bacterium]|nr:rhomboid family intramembrane serine protease [Bacteroidales bacterium]
MNLTPCAKYLLITNIIVFVICMAYPPATDALALYYIKSEQFKPYQFFTYIFVHSGFTHIFFNMFALYQFGSIIESVWGSKRFSFYYIVCGLGAAIVNMLVNYYQIAPAQEAAEALIANPTVEGLRTFAAEHSYLFKMQLLDDFITNYQHSPDFAQAIKDIVSKAAENFTARPVVGASGAVFGLLLAFGMMFPDMKLQFMFIPIGIKAKYFVLLYGAAELFFGVNDFSGDNIAHFAHLGGMLFGIIMILWWKRNPHNDFFNA